MIAAAVDLEEASRQVSLYDVVKWTGVCLFQVIAFTDEDDSLRQKLHHRQLNAYQFEVLPYEMLLFLSLMHNRVIYCAGNQ